MIRLEMLRRAAGRLAGLFAVKLMVSGVLLGLAVIGLVLLQSGRMSPFGGKSSAMGTSAAVEERWGIRVTQVGVTADGGMVDFRFQVLDPDKAGPMLDDVKNLPVMIAEDSGGVINSAAQMAHKQELNAGQTYFLLYRNAGGAIKIGTPVTVAFPGDVRLEHVAAR